MIFVKAAQRPEGFSIAYTTCEIDTLNIYIVLKFSRRLDKVATEPSAKLHSDVCILFVAYPWGVERAEGIHRPAEDTDGSIPMKNAIQQPLWGNWETGLILFLYNINV